MAANTLNILMPSVNNLTRAGLRPRRRARVRGGRRLGHKDDARVPRQGPGRTSPRCSRRTGLPRGSLWESCAIMQYLCNKHGLDRLYPTDPGERAMNDSAMFYLIGTFYPLVARATYPTLGFPQYAGEVGDLRGRRRAEGQGAAGRADALAEPLEAFHRILPGGQRFIGGDSPTIADIRLAATLEFLRAIDYDFPAWAEEYMGAVEAALGDAYSEPAGDVRGFVASAK